MQAIADGRMYGMALVDIHTPDSLKEKFHDMPPHIQDSYRRQGGHWGLHESLLQTRGPTEDIEPNVDFQLQS